MYTQNDSCDSLPCDNATIPVNIAAMIIMMYSILEKCAHSNYTQSKIRKFYLLIRSIVAKLRSSARLFNANFTGIIETLQPVHIGIYS